MKITETKIPDVTTNNLDESIFEVVRYRLKYKTDRNLRN